MLYATLLAALCEEQNEDVIDEFDAILADTMLDEISRSGL